MQTATVIPPFGPGGLLPVGTYSVTFSDLKTSQLVYGYNGTSTTWDSTWRAHLVDNAALLVGELWQIGINAVFLDGSFVEEKDHPNDVDGYFECDARTLATGQLEQQLNVINPFKIWTWDPNSRRHAAGYMKRQLPMWHQYRVELYPHHPGLLTDITDSFGNEMQFPSAFRQQRATHLPKGIIRIIK